MDIREIDRSDEDQLRQFWQVGKLAEDAYRPYDFYVPWETARTAWVDGRPGYESMMFGAFDGDELLGRAYLGYPMLDNTHLAFVDVHVRPDHQRRGIGRVLVDRACDAARTFGRRTLVAETYGPLDQDGPGLAFARATGFTEALEQGMKIVDLVETEASWDALAQEAAARMDGYALVPWVDVVPEELMDGYCHLNEAFNDEAPSGELELEAEVWDAERVRGDEAQRRRAGRHVLRRRRARAGRHHGRDHRGGRQRPRARRGLQSGTLVLPAHRGHALGLAMKVANHRALRAALPQCRVLLTGNAGVNAAMNAVNDRLGYREVERSVEVQKEL